MSHLHAPTTADTARRSVGVDNFNDATAHVFAQKAGSVDKSASC